MDPTILKIARAYNLSLQMSRFLKLLIVNDCTTAKHVYESLGSVECRWFAYRLRACMPNLVLNSQRAVGYWLDDSVRSALAKQFDLELPTDLAARIKQEGTKDASLAPIQPRLPGEPL